MLVALTGTPGTGKNSVAEVLSRKGYYIVHLDQFAEERGLIVGFDEGRGTREVDIEALDRELHVPAKLGILVGHYAHFLSVSVAIVLRCRPRVLTERLRARGWADAKVRENVEAEAIDVITQEAVEGGAPVFEVDTTSATPSQTADTVLDLLQGKTEGHEAGSVDWTDEVLSWY